MEEAEEEEEDNESVASGFTPPKEGCYEIIATMKDSSLPKPDFVKEVIQVISIYVSVNLSWFIPFNVFILSVTIF